MRSHVLTLVVGCVAAFPARSYDITSYCESVGAAVGGRYQIEAGCRQQEERARASIARIDVPARISSYCESVGEAVGGSYQIMESCIDQELRAKNSLR